MSFFTNFLFIFFCSPPPGAVGMRALPLAPREGLSEMYPEFDTNQLYSRFCPMIFSPVLITNVGTCSTSISELTASPPVQAHVGRPRRATRSPWFVTLTPSESFDPLLAQTLLRPSKPRQRNNNTAYYEGVHDYLILLQ